MAQERQIEKEIADNIPLISDKIGLDALLHEYQYTDDELYQKKIYVGAIVHKSPAGQPHSRTLISPLAHRT